MGKDQRYVLTNALGSDTLYRTEHSMASFAAVFACSVFILFLNLKQENAVKETLVRGSNRKAMGWRIRL